MATFQEWYPIIIGVVQVLFLIGVGLLIMRFAKSEAVKAWCGVAFQVLGVQFIGLKIWEFAQLMGFINYG